MKTSSQDGARRRLDFQEKPYRNKTFFVDVKTNALKVKVQRRINQLGGRVEGFLSKDICLLITDRNEDRPNEKNQKEKEKMGDTTSPMESSQNKMPVPLSRGMALLMKAQKNDAVSTCGMDPVQNAKLLGVDVQKVSYFLKDSNKLLYKLRQPKCDKEGLYDDMGLSPLKWKDKENMVVIKIEDSEQMFKPLIKHLDMIPIIRYDDDFISPFDTSVPLCKKTERNKNRYSTQRKSLQVPKKGGFCEPCDYWYKCSLREHLNSEQHKKFVRNIMNFEKLDEIISKLPRLYNFISRYTSNQISQKENSTRNLSNLPEVEMKSDVLLPPLLENMNDNQHLSATGLKTTCHSLSPPVLDKVHVNKIDSHAGDKVETSCPMIQIANDESSHAGQKVYGSQGYNPNFKQMDAPKETCSDCQNPENFPTSNADSITAKKMDEVGSIQSKLVTDYPSMETQGNISGNICVSEYMSCEVKTSSNLPPDLNMEMNVKGFTLVACENQSTAYLNCDNNDNTVSTPFNKQTMDSQNVSMTTDIYSGDTESCPSSDLKNCLIDGHRDTTCHSHKFTDDTPIVTTFRGAFKHMDMSLDKCENFAFHPNLSPISSPCSMQSTENFSFKEVASNWMKDISQNKPNAVNFESENMSSHPAENDSHYTYKYTALPMPGSCSKPVSNISSSPHTSHTDLSREELKMTNLFQSSNLMAGREQCVPNFESSEKCGSDYSELSKEISSSSLSNFEQELHRTVNNTTMLDDAISMPTERRQTPSCVMRLSELPNAETGDELSLISLPETRHSESSRSSISTFTDNSGTPVSRFSKSACKYNSSTSFNQLQDNSYIGSEAQTPKALDDSVFEVDTSVQSPRLEPIKLKINLSGIHIKPVSDNKRVVKGKRRLMSAQVNTISEQVSYRAVQQSETCLKLCRVVATPVQKNHDIRNFWKVRKSGGCRLVFSSEKRKADRMNSNSSDCSPNHNNYISKRKRLYCE